MVKTDPIVRIYGPRNQKLERKLYEMIVKHKARTKFVLFFYYNKSNGDFKRSNIKFFVQAKLMKKTF